jgi:hypothetical protein
MRLLCTTLIAALLAAAPCLAATPAVPAAGAVRELRFARGHDSVTVRSAVVRGERHFWRFGARAGQQAVLRVTSVEHNAVIQVWRPGAILPASADNAVAGTALAGADEGDDATGWEGVLPDSGDYLVEVGGTRGNASYRLTLRIKP